MTKKNNLLLFFSVFILSLGIHFIGIYTFESFILKHSFFYDPSIFYNKFIHLNTIYLSEQEKFHSFSSRLYMSLNEFKDNYFFSFRTITTLVLCPKMLGNIHGHLFTGFPMFFCCAFLYTFTLFNYSDKKVAILLSFLFLFSPSFIDAKFGVGVFWLDTAPTFLLLSTLICIYNWDKTDKLNWLLWGGILLSIAIMSRYLFCVWGFLTITPLFLFFCYQKYTNNWNLYWKPIVFLLLGISISLPFIIYNFTSFLNYYLTQDYGYGGSMKGAILFFIAFLKNIVGYFFLIQLVIVASVIYFLNPSNYNIKRSLMLLITLMIIPLFLIVILKTENNNHLFHTSFILLGLPLLFLGHKAKISSKTFLILLLFITFSSMYGYNNKIIGATTSLNNQESSMKSIETTIVNDILHREQGKTITVYSTLKEKHICNLNIEYFMLTQRELREGGENSFYTNDAVWNFTFPGASIQNRENLIFDAMKKNNFIILYDSLNDYINNDLYGKVSLSLYPGLKNRINTDSSIKEINRIKSNSFPDVIIYENIK